MLTQMAGPRSSGGLYTPEQIDTYLSYISFPITQHKTITQAVARTKEGLAYLSKLQLYHLVSVPFENLSLHYSSERVISLDIDDLYEKIVGSKTGRGGYCMEQNIFFGVVMRTLGYEVIPTGARVMTAGGVTGW
jgi:arylamine N-acetyltransferase